MSYSRDLTTEQTRLHADLERWAHLGGFLDDDMPTTTSETDASENVLCARFCDRLDAVVGSSHFDVDAFDSHVWYLRDSPNTSGNRLDALRRFQATVRAKHESIFPDDDEGDDARDTTRKMRRSGSSGCVVS